jgi:hypothetical protein
MVRKKDFEGVSDGLLKTLSQNLSGLNEAIHEKPQPQKSATCP